MNMFGTTWTPFLMAAERLCTLSFALIPELIQNWLDITSNGIILHDLELKILLLSNVEPLIHLINKKIQISNSNENRSSQSNTEVIIEPTTNR